MLDYCSGSAVLRRNGQFGGLCGRPERFVGYAKVVNWIAYYDYGEMARNIIIIIDDGSRDFCDSILDSHGKPGWVHVRWCWCATTTDPRRRHFERPQHSHQDVIMDIMDIL